MKLKRYGHSLIDEIERGARIDAHRFINLWVSICDAIAHVHNCGFAHMDIKPDNILVTGDKFVLCDFNLTQHSSQSVLAMGTDIYAAHELPLRFAFGRGAKTPRSNCWNDFSFLGHSHLIRLVVRYDMACEWVFSTTNTDHSFVVCLCSRSLIGLRAVWRCHCCGDYITFFALLCGTLAELRPPPFSPALIARPWPCPAARRRRWR
jgi:serine/threonine protein kinase